MAKKNNATDHEKPDVVEETVQAVEEAVEAPAPIVEAPHEVVSEYTIDELAAGAEAAFGCMPEMVMAALMEKKITKCSKAEAAEIVEAFKKKEVK